MFSMPDKSNTQRKCYKRHFMFATYYVILTIRCGKCHRLSPVVIMTIMMLKLHVKSCIGIA